jgi:hypothetical protein
MKMASSNRSVNKTDMNENCSRKLVMVLKDIQNIVVVDLAGTEDVGRSGGQ